MRALCLVLLVVFVLFSSAVLAGSTTSPLPSVQNVSLLDRIGLAIKSTLFGQIKVAETHRKAGGVFNGSSLDPNYSTTTAANGSVSVLNGEAVLDTTVDSGSSAILTTIGVARYIASNSNVFRGTVRVTTTSATNNARSWGAFDGTAFANGYWFRLNNSTFQIVTANNGVLTTTANGSFNGDYPTYTLDTKYHDYEILYSGRKVMFTIDGALIHTVEAGEEPIVAIRHLKPFMSSVSTGVGAVAGLRTLSLTISLLGTPKTQPLNRHIAGTTTGTLIKTGPGTLRMLSVNSSTNVSQITVYDALSASDSSKIIADIKLNVSAPPVPLPYEWDFNTGLYVVIAGTGTDISIGYE